ncbi:hypothetical protein NPIL_411341 [Nephila pilipes]|uniref:Uncharacterized protein n=1 Tax=Nephila pilipes TaxID=299642 RepID=A0A8X6MG71_NEPPI|nr:hypothetical protein NPIL_411341 [Nephila pilipes]
MTNLFRFYRLRNILAQFKATTENIGSNNFHNCKDRDKKRLLSRSQRSSHPTRINNPDSVLPPLWPRLRSDPSSPEVTINGCHREIMNAPQSRKCPLREGSGIVYVWALCHATGINPSPGRTKPRALARDR